MHISVLQNQKLHQCIQMELIQKSKYYYDRENEISVTYFYQLGKAFVEAHGQSYWIESSGVQDALEQYFWINKKELIAN